MAETTADAIAAFFDRLAAHGPDPRLAKATGTMRFEIAHGRRTERWFMAVKKGEVSVSRKNSAADLVIHADRPLFERVVRGKANAMAAFLRGEISIEGFAPQMLVLFQGLLPRPRDARRVGRAAGYARRMR
jgi:hypothetical protein